MLYISKNPPPTPNNKRNPFSHLHPRPKKQICPINEAHSTFNKFLLENP